MCDQFTFCTAMIKKNRLNAKMKRASARLREKWSKTNEKIEF